MQKESVFQIYKGAVIAVLRDFSQIFGAGIVSFMSDIKNLDFFFIDYVDCGLGSFIREGDCGCGFGVNKFYVHSTKFKDKGTL